MDVMEKWKKSVIHLECAADSQSLTSLSLLKLMERVDKGEISQEEFAEKVSAGKRDLRYHGTAIFLQHDCRRYLFTARHVVYDKVAAERELKEQEERMGGSSGLGDMILLKTAREAAANRFFSIVFRVPSLQEVLARGQRFVPQFLMNLGAGTSWSVPYTFSRPGLDLAIISLDQRDSKFADELLTLGYIPLSMQDLSDGPSAEAADVFTVGYPAATAIVEEMTLPPAQANWASKYSSIPTFAFGKVSMLVDERDFFWCDMSIFPGNSGGPVVENDKMVGIVSAQPTIPSDVHAAGGQQLPLVAYTRIPFGKMIKAKFIKELLEAQIGKDKAFSRK